MSDQDLVVNRWRRYGNDRLYVETPDGARVGFWDLVSQTAHPESPEHEMSLLVAVAQWRSEGLGQTGPASDAAVVERPAAAEQTVAAEDSSDQRTQVVPPPPAGVVGPAQRSKRSAHGSTWPPTALEPKPANAPRLLATQRPSGP